MQQSKLSSSSSKKPYFLMQDYKSNSKQRLKSMSSSGIRNNNSSLDNGVKLSNSYYNDRQAIYIKRSRQLSQKSLSYQSKQISFSQRKKYNRKQIENIVQSRTIQSEKNRQLSHNTMSLPSMNRADRDSIRTRINSLNAKKFSQLVYGTRQTEHRIKLLNRDVSEKRLENQKEDKWVSPFRDTNTFKVKFQGKNLVPKKLEGLMSNANPSQLKVLNIDRMFRVKNGKLGNVIPIPVAKLSSISSRQQVVKTIKKKDTIHQVIQQYNKLLKLAKLERANKSTKKIGIRGHNFTRSPTLEQLMGIKMHEYHKSKEIKVVEEEISEDLFFKYNQFYRKEMKQDVHLARRLMAGVKQSGKFDLEAFTRFYAIFVNKIAGLHDKIKFLVYFFIPHGQEKIQLGVLKLILELMCEELPQISNLKTHSELLTKQQKSKIFLQALNRVLFSDLKQFTGDGQVMINRHVLQMLLQRNEDAVSLLIRLLLSQ